MKYFDVDKIENDIEELKQELRNVIKDNQAKYVIITGVSKQHINRFVHTGEALSLKKMIYIYKCIQAAEK